MKILLKNYVVAVLSVMSLISCTEITDEPGFLSPDIYLKGADTIYIPLGSKGSTDIAWLDGSSMPVEFSIYDVRDQSGQTSHQFFDLEPYRTWIRPYNNKTDTTMALIEEKLSEVEMPPLIINPVNGMLTYLETSSKLQNPGDVFFVDVKAENSAGSKIYEDYATIKLSGESKPFDFYRSTVSIILVNDAGETKFTLYDYIPEEDLERRQNIYDRNGKELIDVYKVSDEPSVGVKVIIQYVDAEGNVFDSSEYQTYSETTESYFDYAVNRENTSEGAVIEFPMTPWPTNQGLLSYLRGGTMDFTVLDTASLRKEVYVNEKYEFLDPWPAPDFGASQWYIRLRSKIIFRENGTYMISTRFPFTHLDKTFDNE